MYPRLIEGLLFIPEVIKGSASTQFLSEELATYGNKRDFTTFMLAYISDSILTHSRYQTLHTTYSRNPYGRLCVSIELSLASA